MQSRLFAAIIVAGALAVSASVIAVAQSTAPAGEGSATGPAPAAKPSTPDFRPAMDDLMTMLVQPRHIKLFYAGQAKNWKLAAFESNELRDALARIGRTIPTYRNLSVDTAVASIFADKLKTVDAAIKAADPAQFTVTYAELTQACNACHRGLEHPFIKIMVPDAANYPDQDFRP